jgi:hypothetical protein
MDTTTTRWALRVERDERRETFYLVGDEKVDLLVYACRRAFNAGDTRRMVLLHYGRARHIVEELAIFELDPDGMERLMCSCESFLREHDPIHEINEILEEAGQPPTTLEELERLDEDLGVGFRRVDGLLRYSAAWL